MGLFLVINFPKIVKTSIFLLNFIRNFRKCLKITQQCVFCPNARKISALFVNFFGKYAKIGIFSNFLKDYFKVFENSPAYVGLRPLDPQEADPPKSVSLEPKSWLRPCPIPLARITVWLSLDLCFKNFKNTNVINKILVNFATLDLYSCLKPPLTHFTERKLKICFNFSISEDSASEDFAYLSGFRDSAVWNFCLNASSMTWNRIHGHNHLWLFVNAA